MTATISKPNDTYTELNRGVNGSKMDETLVTQVDPDTFAEVVVHRERIVLGLDTGELVGPPVDGYVELPTTDRLVLAALESIHATLQDILVVLMKSQ